VDRVREESETAALRSESSGLWNLLDLVCDVVVSLDDQLRITDKASRFSALVMTQGRNVEGECLKDFMPELADREAFERCATAQTSLEDTAPRAIHVKLRDGLGNMLRVELFCVQVQHVLKTTHFIGIREFSDCALLPEFKRFDAAARGGRRAFPVTTPATSRGTASDSGSDRSGGTAEQPASPQPSASAEGPGGLLETSDEAIQMALVRTMRMLCVSGRSEAVAPIFSGDSQEDCCAFHARVASLRGCVRSLGLRPCVRRFKCYDWSQCEVCGMLAEAPSVGSATRCFACGSEVCCAVACPRVLQTL